VIIQTTYDIGETVYLRLAECEKPGYVVGITITPHGHYYAVCFHDNRSIYQAYDFELSHRYEHEYDDE
jgi:hypothetical protein